MDQITRAMLLTAFLSLRHTQVSTLGMAIPLIDRRFFLLLLIILQTVMAMRHIDENFLQPLDTIFIAASPIDLRQGIIGLLADRVREHVGFLFIILHLLIKIIYLGYYAS